jgi:hypothetical protein
VSRIGDDRCACTLFRQPLALLPVHPCCEHLVYPPPVKIQNLEPPAADLDLVAQIGNGVELLQQETESAKCGEGLSSA